MNNNDNGAPPMPLWKLALLMLATAGLYQLVWLYRASRDAAAARGRPTMPWLWACVPLLGPFAAIPAFVLANRIKRWQIESGAKIGHLAEPLFVSILLIAAFLPLGLYGRAWADVPRLLVIAALLTCLPYLAIQGQINLNKRGADPSIAPAQFGVAQLVTLAIGTGLAVPLYAFTLTNVLSGSGGVSLSLGDVVAAEDAFFRVRIAEEGWRRVETGVLSNDSSLEFLGPGDDSWAIVYDSTGVDVDSVLAFRADRIRSDYTGARCRQWKSLAPGSLVVVGTLDCEGRNPFDGEYVVLSRVLADRTRVAEIVGATSHFDRARFEELVPRLRSFMTGLELEP